LGYNPNIQHAMLSRNEAQQRPGHRPSAPQAFHQLTNPNGNMAPQPKQRQPGAPTAAEGAAGIRSTTCTSLILGGPPSPLPLSSTTHHTMMIPQQAALTTNGEARQERRAQQAPHYSIKNGTEQPDSSSLQLGGGSTPVAVTPAAARCTLQLARFGTPHMRRLARDLPFGAGLEQAKLAMDPQPDTNKQIISNDHGKLQERAQAPETRQLFKLGTPHMHRPAQNLSFGEALQVLKLGTPHMHRPAQDLPFGAEQE